MTTYRLRAITHNVTGGGDPNFGDLAAVDLAVSQASAFNADLLVLQEVTESQYAALASQLAGWSTWHTHLREAEPDRESQGQVLASRWPMTDVVETPLGYHDGGKTYTFTHADVTLPTGVVVRAGTTHLRAYQFDPAKVARRRQAQAIAVTLAPYVDAGRVVCWGGDLNSTPTADSQDYLYAVSGGDFYECDQTDSSNTGPRDGDPTEGNDKLDYLFFSKRCTTTASLSGGQITAPLSDHNLLRGYADVAPATSLL